MYHAKGPQNMAIKPLWAPHKRKQAEDPQQAAQKPAYLLIPPNKEQWQC